MIPHMSLRCGLLVLALDIVTAGGCGGTETTGTKEPTTAREKQYQEAKASGELDDKSRANWTTWRYQGERKDCKFVLGRKCFKTQKAACSAAACRSTCDVIGAGPATVSCKKKK